jgi:hypothetical protein
LTPLILLLLFRPLRLRKSLHTFPIDFPHLLRADSETSLRPRSLRTPPGSFKSRKVPAALVVETKDKDNLSPKMQVLSDIMSPTIGDSFKASVSFTAKQMNMHQSFNSKRMEMPMPSINLGAGSQRNLQVLRRKSNVSHQNSQKSSSTSQSQLSSKSVTSSKGESNFMVGESNFCPFPSGTLKTAIIKIDSRAPKPNPQPLTQISKPLTRNRESGQPQVDTQYPKSCCLIP